MIESRSNFASVVSKFILLPTNISKPSPGRRFIKIEKSDAELVHPDHRGLMRSLNRSGRLLTYGAHQIERHWRDEIQVNPHRVAVYCVTEQSAGDHVGILECERDSDLPMITRFGRSISPKWMLQSSIGMVAASISIVLGVRGGVHTFHHPQFACGHALDQAAIDLNVGAVDLALICAVNSIEDPIMLERRLRQDPQIVLAEAVVILLLKIGDSFPPANLYESRRSDRLQFGVAGPLVGAFESNGKVSLG